MISKEELLKTYTDSHLVTKVTLNTVKEARKYGFRLYQYDGTFNYQENLYWAAIFCLSISCKESILDEYSIGCNEFKLIINALLKEKTLLKKDAEFILEITPKTKRL
jgi:hypothetical protein